MLEIFLSLRIVYVVALHARHTSLPVIWELINPLVRPMLLYIYVKFIFSLITLKEIKLTKYLEVTL